MTVTEPQASVGGLDPSEILLGLNNGPGVYRAPAGTAPPADLITDWADPWEPIGYISDDGVTVSSSTTSDTLTPWQSTSPVKTMITGKELTAHFIMWQTNADTLAMYFDMPPVAPDAGGIVAFDIRSDVGGELYAIGIDIKDAGTITRIVFGRAQLSDTGDVAFTRGSAVGWEVTLSAMDENGILAHLMSGPETPPAGNGVVEGRRRAPAPVAQ
jgi:hypothetical protein